MNKKAKQDILACLVIYAFMLFCFVQTLSMKSGSATMPRIILSLALICNTALLIRTFGQLKKDASGEGYTSIAEIKVPILMFFGIVLYCLLFNFCQLFYRNGSHDFCVYDAGESPAYMENRCH